MADHWHINVDDDPEVQADLQFLRDTLGSYDPAHATAGMPTRQQARERIAGVLADTRAVRQPERPPTRRHSRRKVLALVGGGAVATAGAAAGLVALDVPRSRPGYAATPQTLTVSEPDAPESLERIAAQAGGPVKPMVDHLVTDLWDLNSIVEGRRATSAIIASRRELWRDREGAALTIDWYLPPQFPTAEDRDNWLHDGSPQGGDETRTDYGHGEFPAAFHGRPPQRPETLAKWLSRTDTSDTAIISGTADLLNERALTGPERTVLLRTLARVTALKHTGTTVDRAGRRGSVFTLSSHSSGAEITHLLVIDPDTATILGYEQILTAGANALRVRRPAVISYRTYRTADFVPAMP